jgi:hypothetical protein
MLETDEIFCCFFSCEDLEVAVSQTFRWQIPQVECFTMVLAAGHPGG